MGAMTLIQCIDLHGYYAQYVCGSWYVHGMSLDLWGCSDYAVSSVSGGVVRLIKKRVGSNLA